MTEKRAESIWAVALSDPLRVRVLRYMLNASAAEPAVLADSWGTSVDMMQEHFHLLRELEVIEHTNRPGRRDPYRLCSGPATQEALWRLGAPLPVHIDARFSMRLSTIIASHSTAVRRLRARRESMGFSQSQLARRVGVGEEKLGRIERAQEDPRLSLVLVLADELNFPLDQLFAGGPEHHADACP